MVSWIQQVKSLWYELKQTLKPTQAFIGVLNQQVKLSCILLAVQTHLLPEILGASTFPFVQWPH